MSDSHGSDQFWDEDLALSEVMDKIQEYETWVVEDPDVLQSMDESVRQVLAAIDTQYQRMQEYRPNGDHSEFLESMLIILGFMPAKKALYYLTSFQQYQGFFEALANKLSDAPPLKDYAKTLLARASVLQQRQLQMAVNSQENFNQLTQALERIFEKG
ncbi:type IVB secretion system protein IcmW [Neptuniibacter halophilus]|uniref:type IVB secretion system protein IcmW n=1 Tax=Neptuniibacter halophilus TaxID=651666 RepID=UPI0025731B64|nr:hypothetical protein [Neptuniibacter halophilus]